jgi:hypothetical protein
MRQKRSKIKYALCSLPFFLLFAGCNEGPKLTVCIMDGENEVLQCRDPKGKVFALTPKGSNNYVCMSPSDTEALLNYCKRK